MRPTAAAIVAVITGCSQSPAIIDARHIDAIDGPTPGDACSDCGFEDAAFEWEVTLDSPTGEQVFPRAVVRVSDSVMVLAEPNNYLVRTDHTVVKSAGPTWYAPHLATAIGNDVGVFFYSDQGESVGVVDGDTVAFDWTTPLPVRNETLVLFKAAPALSALWQSDSGTVLSVFDATGTDTLAKPIVMPGNVYASGGGYASGGTLLAPAFVGIDDPCSVLSVDAGAGTATVGPALAPEHRTSDCVLSGESGSLFVQWGDTQSGTLVFASIDDSGGGAGVQRNSLTNSAYGQLAGPDLVGATGSLLTYYASGDRSAPPTVKRIAVAPDETVYETALGTDGTDAYVAFRVASAGNEYVRLQKLSHVH